MYKNYSNLKKVYKLWDDNICPEYQNDGKNLNNK